MYRPLVSFEIENVSTVTTVIFTLKGHLLGIFENLYLYRNYSLFTNLIRFDICGYSHY